MWKKDDETNAPGGPSQDRPAAPPRRPARRGEPATIGPSITIKGEVTGDEDLLIEGRIDGSVELEDHAVTVGADGRVSAHITGRVVTVEGEVEGDLIADEQIILRGSARVEGDIKAPRVVLEDGARFRGLVDMGSGAKKTSGGSGTRAAAPAGSSSSGGGSGSGSATASAKDGEGKAKEGDAKAAESKSGSEKAKAAS